MTTTVYNLKLDGVGPVDLTVDEQGEGRPFLLLHGGGGPGTVAGFGALLAGSRPARVISPTHPGFGGTPRPEALHTVAGLAGLYVALP
jgi:pimeloyl-ACP methyl ester carboxylesterase